MTQALLIIRDQFSVCFDYNDQMIIRIKLKQLLDDKAFAERRRITLNEVSEATGISRPTLTRIANTPGYNTNTETIAALCEYFSCQPGDLLEGIDEK